MTSSIILTIHNKAFLLPTTLSALLELTDWTDTELIMILDGCVDGSKNEVEHFKFKNHNLPIRIYETPDIFETKANNVGCKASSADYVIILQDDQLITEVGWNKRILLPFTLWDDVFAVTGNCAHDWALNHNYNGVTNPGEWCQLLLHTNHANKNNTPENIFTVKNSVNRGPLAINRQNLVELNYFDEIYAPSDMDEHDLVARMKKKMNKVVGFVNVGWESRSEWGGTRNADGSTKQWALDAQKKNVEIYYERHKDIINNDYDKFEDRCLSSNIPSKKTNGHHAPKL